MRILTCIVLMVGLSFSLSFGWGSTDLTDWILGTNVPAISSARPAPAGYSGDCIHVPVGTSPFYYEAGPDGDEGTITYFIYDPGNCLENPDPGYGARGPKWGLQNPSYAAIVVGIDRASYISGCQGYTPWTTLSPYSPYWFFDGARGSHGQSFTPGWYKWQCAGTWDDITFTLYDIYFKGVLGGGSDPDWAQGDAIGTIDDQWGGSTFAPALGDGWTSFHIRGDNASGIEDISIFIVEGTGIFIDAGTGIPVSRAYQETSWGNIKALFR